MLHTDCSSGATVVLQELPERVVVLNTGCSSDAIVVGRVVVTAIVYVYCLG